MHQINRNWTRIFSILVITPVAVFSAAQTAHAEGIITDWSEKIRSAPLRSSGYGLLGLVIAFNGFIIAAVLAAIILSIGLGLGYITLWNLAFYFWGIGYSSLVLAFSLFALSVFYVSKVIVS